MKIFRILLDNIAMDNNYAATHITTVLEDKIVILLIILYSCNNRSKFTEGLIKNQLMESFKLLNIIFRN